MTANRPHDDIRFTVLESGGNTQHPLCKKFTKSKGRIEKENYQNQYLFNWFEQSLEGFDDLAWALNHLQSESYACVVLGKVKPNAPRLICRLKYDDLERSGPENKAWIEDVPTKVVHFDFDELEILDWLDWSTPDLVAGYVVEHLTDRLGVPDDVSYFWQASSSAAVGGCKIAKMHIWMLSDTALDGPRRKALYELAGADKAIGSSVHIQYTAAPMFSGMSDPLPMRSGIVKGGTDDLPVSNIMSELEAHMNATARVVEFSAERMEQIGELGAREVAIVQKRLRRIKDGFFRTRVRGNRNNTLNRAAFEIGTIAHFGVGKRRDRTR